MLSVPGRDRRSAAADLSVGPPANRVDARRCRHTVTLLLARQPPHASRCRSSCHKCHIFRSRVHRGHRAAWPFGTSLSARRSPSVPAWLGRVAVARHSPSPMRRSTQQEVRCYFVLSTTVSANQPGLLEHREHDANLPAPIAGVAARIASKLSVPPGGAVRRASINVLKSAWVGYRPAMKNDCRRRSLR